MLQQASRFRGHAPSTGVGNLAPLIDTPAQFIDDRGRIILLGGARNPLALIKNYLLLKISGLALLRFRDRNRLLTAAAALAGAISVALT